MNESACSNYAGEEFRRPQTQKLCLCGLCSEIMGSVLFSLSLEMLDYPRKKYSVSSHWKLDFKPSGNRGLSFRESDNARNSLFKRSNYWNPRSRVPSSWLFKGLLCSADSAITTSSHSLLIAVIWFGSGRSSLWVSYCINNGICVSDLWRSSHKWAWKTQDELFLPRNLGPRTWWFP